MKSDYLAFMGWETWVGVVLQEWRQSHTEDILHTTIGARQSVYTRRVTHGFNWGLLFSRVDQTLAGTHQFEVFD